MTKEEKEVYDIIQDALKLEVNQKDGYVTIGYTFPRRKGLRRLPKGCAGRWKNM